MAVAADRYAADRRLGNDALVRTESEGRLRVGDKIVLGADGLPQPDMEDEEGGSERLRARHTGERDRLSVDGVDRAERLRGRDAPCLRPDRALDRERAERLRTVDSADLERLAEDHGRSS